MYLDVSCILSTTPYNPHAKPQLSLYLSIFIYTIYIFYTHTHTDPVTGALQPRCPQYDIYVTGNEGATYQSGCGFDPYDTGCCVETSASGMECYACAQSKQTISNSTFFCRGDYYTVIGLKTELDKFRDWLDIFGNFKMCGAYHNPRFHEPLVEPQDYGIVKYYTDFLSRDEYSNRNYLNNQTSNRFLCNVRYWMQGDYTDDGGFGDIQVRAWMHIYIIYI